jgi:hypothetical protein
MLVIFKIQSFLISFAPKVLRVLSYCSLVNSVNPSCSHLSKGRVSSVSIVSDYGLDDRAIGVRFPAGAKDFSCSLCVQTGSGAHPTSCLMGSGGPFPGGKSAAGA